MFNQSEVESRTCKQPAAKGCHKPKELLESCHLSLPCLIHGVDFGSIARIDGVAAKFTIRGDAPVLRGKTNPRNKQISHLPEKLGFTPNRIPLPPKGLRAGTPLPPRPATT